MCREWLMLLLLIAPSLLAADDTALGTGFAISQNGYVLTSFHVVKACRTVAVRIGDGTVAPRVVASDARNDVALLKMDSVRAFLTFR
jgi:S1-C subfamily serine protease